MCGCGSFLPEFTELLARPVQAALYRADRQIERLSNLFFRKVVPVTHHDRGPIGRIQGLTMAWICSRCSPWTVSVSG